MKTRDLLKDIKGVFKPPKKKYYLGLLKFGTPYFYPRNFNPTIIKVRKLKKRHTYSNTAHYESSLHNKYSNLPVVRRSKYWVLNDWYIEVGWPIKVGSVRLGWKDKYDSPRFEWPPMFYINFFGLQFCIWWLAPKLEGKKYHNNDDYYEMILWFLVYNGKNINKAEETWGWTDYYTKMSTWNNNYLIKK